MKLLIVIIINENINDPRPSCQKSNKSNFFSLTTRASIAIRIELEKNTTKIEDIKTITRDIFDTLQHK